MMEPGQKYYVRPIPGPRDRVGAWPMGRGPLGFNAVEVLWRNAPPQILPVEAVTEMYPDTAAFLARARAPRTGVLGLDLRRPAVMGVLNVTPDSFSDGGRFSDISRAVEHALEMAAAGADLIDIGGESTRPGAEPVDPAEEAARVVPVIEAVVAAFRAAGLGLPVSIDTRRADVARAGLAAGARLFNDVSALGHDPDAPGVALGAGAVCLMHAQGDPRTMQTEPRYDDVLLDVFDFLEARVEAAEAAGIDRARLIIDPGIGFGKTLGHNLALIRGLALFQTLGCTVLLGVSRKGFIGRIADVPQPDDRAPGSIAAALAGLDQGVQILRVHDVAETVQAVRVWQAIREDT